MEAATIVSKAKRVLQLISLSFILIFAFNSLFRVLNETFGLKDMLLLALGGYIIYSLYQARTWAKNYIMVCCVLFAVFTIPGMIGSLVNLNLPELLLQTVVLAWSLSIVWFLSKSELYEKYQELVQKGYDFETNTTVQVSEIVNPKFVLPIQFTEIKTLMDYQKLTENIFSQFGMDRLIEKIGANEEGKVFIETEEKIFELEYDQDSIFFDQNYLQRINFVLEQLSKDDKYLDIIYPATTLDKQQKSLVLASPEEYRELKNRGFYE